jgi:hypothetical protein
MTHLSVINFTVMSTWYIQIYIFISCDTKMNLARFCEPHIISWLLIIINILDSNIDILLDVDGFTSVQ